MPEFSDLVIQDWIDYDKCSLYDLSHKYYATRACDSFVNNENTVVLPNLITSNYVHAYTLANLLKANLELIPENKKLKVLEFGSGSGLFARNFLLAAEELGYLDRLTFIVTDISELFLEQMHSRAVFQGFTLAKHYELVKLDLLDLDSATTLNGEKFILEDLDLVVSNYVLNAVPMIPLRYSDAEPSVYERLQLKISSSLNPESVDLARELDFFSTLKIEERWVKYSLEEASDTEKKYFPLFKAHLDKLPAAQAGRFSYKALEIIEELNSRLSEYGMFYLVDISSLGPNALKYYSFYTNALANLLSEGLLTDLAKSLNMQVLRQQDINVFRVLFYKNTGVFPPLNKIFNQDFVFKNKIALFKKISDLLKTVNDPDLLDVYKLLLDKFLKLDDKSVSALNFQGDYYYLLGDSKRALDFYLKAKEIDFCKHHPDLDSKIAAISYP